MTRRRELDQHCRKLGEMREILGSMKALAYMETRKLNTFLAAQRRVVRSIENAAADFLQHYPELRPGSAGSAQIYLLIGSERGFCGDFNAVLVQQLPADAEALLVAVGHKLHTALGAGVKLAAALDGASVAEEIGSVLAALADTLAHLPQPRRAAGITALFHDEAQGGLQRRALLPPFRDIGARPPAPRPPAPRPLLNVPPPAFFAALVEQYLFAALNEILYASLMAENNRRVQHLEGAVHHLEDKVWALQQQSNALRQEEITEEIEVILLSAENKLTEWRPHGAG